MLDADGQPIRRVDATSFGIGAAIVSGDGLVAVSQQAQPGVGTIEIYAADGSFVRSFPGDLGNPLPFFPSIARFDDHGSRLASITLQGGNLGMHRYDVVTGAEDVVGIPDSPTPVSQMPIAISPDLSQVVIRYGAGGSTVSPLGVGGNFVGIALVGTSEFLAGSDAPSSTTPMFDNSRPGERFAEYTADGSRFVVAGLDGAVPVFAADGAPFSHFGELRTVANMENVAGGALSPTGEVLVVVTNDQPENASSSTMQVIPVRDPAAKFSVPLERAVNMGVGTVFLRGEVVAFGDAPDEVAIVFADGTVEVRSTADGRLLIPRLAAPGPCVDGPPPPPPPPLSSAGPGPAPEPTRGGATAAPAELQCDPRPSVSFAGTVANGRIALKFTTVARVWEVRAATVISIDDLTTTAAEFTTVQLAAGGDRLVTAADSTVHIYDRWSGGWFQRVSFLAPGVLAVSPGGRQLVVADGTNITSYADTGVRMWRVAGRERIARFTGDGSSLITRDIIEPGTLVSSASDGSVQLALQSLTRTQAYAMDVYRVGDHVLAAAVSASLTATVEITDWSVDADGLAASACGVANRNLSAPEWTQYVGTFDPYERTCSRLP